MKLFLGISLFLATVIDTRARVSNNFDNCLQYFYKKQIPSGFQGIAKSDLFDRKNFPDGINVNDLGSPAYICQTFKGTSWFATLYDRGRRMPLYSAYTMDVNAIETSKCARLKTFSVEPQLVYRGVSANMILTKDAKAELSNYNKKHGIQERMRKNQPSYLLQTSQAMDDDYTNTGYNRGHLNPCGHHSANQDGYKATFTLTNIVPMIPTLNNHIWNQYEDEMTKMSPQCKDIYVITGIVPGNIPIKKDGLTAPTYVWNAYCGLDNNDKPIMAGAALAENKDKSTIQKFQKISDFQARLKQLLGVSHDIELFEGGCSPRV